MITRPPYDCSAEHPASSSYAMALCFPSPIPYSLLLFLLSLLSCFFDPSHSQHYHAIFSFGDSLSDAGNLIADGVPSALTTARSPYGMTFFGRPTGRCSDGRLVVDFLGIYL